MQREEMTLDFPHIIPNAFGENIPLITKAMDIMHYQ